MGPTDKIENEHHILSTAQENVQSKSNIAVLKTILSASENEKINSNDLDDQLTLYHESS